MTNRTRHTMPVFHCMASVSVIRAACGRRCGRAISALQNLPLCGTRHQTNQQLNTGERPRPRLSALSPVRNSLSALKVRTLLFNADNDLQAFLHFVRTVRTFLCRYPEETPAQRPAKPARFHHLPPAKTHHQNENESHTRPKSKHIEALLAMAKLPYATA